MRVGRTEVEVDLGEGLHPSVAVKESAVHVTGLAAHVPRVHLPEDSRTVRDDLSAQDRALDRRRGRRSIGGRRTCLDLNIDA